MNEKVAIVGVGISDASVVDWQRTHTRYNRLHVPLDGKAVYHGIKSDLPLQEGRAYLLINSYSPNFALLPDHRYRHMYIDFRVVPPLFGQETIEVDLKEDSFLLYMLKAVQTLIQENIRENGRERLHLQEDGEKIRQIKPLLQAMLMHLRMRYELSVMKDPVIELALRYIDAHYAESIGNEDIAAAVHVDVRNLIRLFTKYMQMPPYQYLTQRRVEHGVEELRSGKSVTETAFLCGYGSETSFRTAFKKVMGCTPRSFLK